MQGLTDATRKVADCHQALVAHSHQQGLALHPRPAATAAQVAGLSAPLRRLP